MNQNIQTAVLDYLLDGDQPLAGAYAEVTHRVSPAPDIIAFVATLECMLANRQVELIRFDTESRRLEVLQVLPDWAAREYSEQPPADLSYDPLHLYLRLPSESLESADWRLHEDLESMTFRLEVRAGDAVEILRDVSAARPRYILSVTECHHEDGLDVVVGTVRDSMDSR